MFFDAMADALPRTAAAASASVLPGAADLIRRLSATPRCLVALITGNEERCARIKLAHFGLRDHFVLGAFGHEHADRTRLARLARERAVAYMPPGQRMGPSFLLGDTPSDIAAARAIGACAVAVATGEFGREELEQAGADMVLDDLGQVRRLGALPGWPRENSPSARL
jgi:phosphoglycolate phosphatase-like HAD superfamily hydrolase